MGCLQSMGNSKASPKANPSWVTTNGICNARAAHIGQIVSWKQLKLVSALSQELFITFIIFERNLVNFVSFMNFLLLEGFFLLLLEHLWAFLFPPRINCYTTLHTFLQLLDSFCLLFSNDLSIGESDRDAWQWLSAGLLCYSNISCSQDLHQWLWISQIHPVYKRKFLSINNYLGGNTNVHKQLDTHCIHSTKQQRFLLD